MKIALVVETFDPQAGGLEKWTVALAAFLLRRGHGVQVVAFRHGNHDLPVALSILPPARGITQRAMAVEEALRHAEVDVVHDTGLSWSGDVYHPQSGSRLVAQARLVATHAMLMRLRAAVSPVSIRWRRDMARLEARQIARARRVVAVSRLVRTQICAQHGIREDTVTVIPNGIDVATYAADRLAPHRAATRARLGVGAGALFLASAFNMRLKGVDTVIRALAVLAAEGVDVRLAVAGGVADDSWRQQAAESGLGGRVSFLGAVADMIPLFAAADVLVHATRWDACSLSTMEGQAAGLPVVTTAMNGASELIEDGTTGFVLPSAEDVPGLTACLRRLLDPNTRDRIGKAARMAATAFDSQRNFLAVEQVLADAMQPRSPDRRR